MRKRRATTPLGGAALLSLLVAACGQTGPLYLPEDDAATVITRPAPATSSAPSAPAPASPRASATGDAAPPASTPTPEAGDVTTPENADAVRREVPRPGS
jgi:predicted small lipoprotein YifL